MKFPALFLVFCTFALSSQAVNAAAAPSALHEARKTLGVTENATRQEIRKAFQNKSFTLHPDKRKDVPYQQATAEWRPIQEAYEMLINAEQENYNKLLKERSDQETKKKRAERQASIKKELDNFLEECDAIEKDKNYDEELFGADLKKLKDKIQRRAKSHNYTVGLYQEEESRLQELKDGLQFAPFTKQIKVLSVAYTLLGNKEKQEEIREFEERIRLPFEPFTEPIAELLKKTQPELEKLQAQAKQDFSIYLSAYQPTDQFKSQLAALREKVAKEQQLTLEDLQVLEKIKNGTYEERAKELAKYNNMLREVQNSPTLEFIFAQEVSPLKKLNELTSATLTPSIKEALEMMYQKAVSLKEKTTTNKAFEAIVTKFTDSYDAIAKVYKNIQEASMLTLDTYVKLLGLIRKKSMIQELITMDNSQIATRQGILLAAIPLLQSLAEKILYFIAAKNIPSFQKDELRQFIANLDSFDFFQPGSIKQLEAAIKNIYDLKFDQALITIPATSAAILSSRILVAEHRATAPAMGITSSRETIQAITVFNQQLTALAKALGH